MAADQGRVPDARGDARCVPMGPIVASGCCADDDAFRAKLSGAPRCGSRKARLQLRRGCNQRRFECERRTRRGRRPVDHVFEFAEFRAARRRAVRLRRDHVAGERADAGRLAAAQHRDAAAHDRDPVRPPDGLERFEHARRDTLGSGCIASGSTASWPVIRESGRAPAARCGSRGRAGCRRCASRTRDRAAPRRARRTGRPTARSRSRNRLPDCAAKLASAAVRCADAKSSDIASRTLPDSGGRTPT